MDLLRAVRPSRPHEGEESVPAWEKAFLGAAVLGQQDAFLNILRVLRGQDAAMFPAPSDPLNMVVVVVSLGGLAVLTSRRPAVVARTAAGAWPLLALCLATLLSASWSIAPDLSAKRAFVHLNTVLLALYMAGRMGFRGALACVAGAGAVAAIASLAVCVASPRIGVMQTPGVEGAWRGVYSHKNAMAEAIEVGALVQAYVLLARRRSGPAGGGEPAWGARLGVAVLAVEGLLLVRAGSVTGLAVSLASVLVLCGLMLVERSGVARHRLLPLVPALVLALAAAATIDPALLTQVSGRDATLTGRTELWAEVTRAIGQRPLLGYGYQAFWDVSDPLAEAIRRQVRWDAPNAHNGYLETALGLGLAGLALALAVLVGTAVAGARLMRRDGGYAAGAATLVLTAMVAVEALTEAVLVQQGAVIWFVLVLVGLAAAQALHATAPEPARTERGVLARARPIAATAP